MESKLKGKRILVVDDEPDVLSVLRDLLAESLVDTAADFETASALLEKNSYEIVILDIMGVRGYDLLDVTTRKDIPTVMLTAHALSPDDLVRSVTKGAGAYVPKDKLAEISVFLEDVLEAREEGDKGIGRWFKRLETFFGQKFGEAWEKKAGTEFWKKYY